jgi:hypothetical protein
MVFPALLSCERSLFAISLKKFYDGAGGVVAIGCFLPCDWGIKADGGPFSTPIHLLFSLPRIEECKNLSDGCTGARAKSRNQMR